MFAQRFCSGLFSLDDFGIALRRSHISRPGLRTVRTCYGKLFTLPLLQLTHSNVMSYPPEPNDVGSPVHPVASEADNSLRRGADSFAGISTSQLVPVIVGASALLLAIGYVVGRQFQPARNRTGVERLAHDLQEWLHEYGTTLPQTLRDRLGDTTDFLSSSFRNLPFDRVIPKPTPKKTSFFNLFS